MQKYSFSKSRLSIRSPDFYHKVDLASQHQQLQATHLNDNIDQHLGFLISNFDRDLSMLTYIDRFVLGFSIIDLISMEGLLLFSREIEEFVGEV